jgi:CAAX protease family protein
MRANVGALGLLGIAMFYPFVLVTVFSRTSFGLTDNAADSLNQITELVICFVIIWIAVWRRDVTLSSLGFKRLRWSSLMTVVEIVGVAYVVLRIAVLLVTRFGLLQPSPGSAALAARPAWLVWMMLVVAGIVEETVYRGYAVAVLSGAVRSQWIAAAVALFVFTAAHILGWGFGPSLIFIFAIGLVLTVYFVIRRDLIANAVAHIIINLAITLGFFTF